MTTQTQQKNLFTNIMTSTLVTLPAPSNLSLMWNMGSLLSLCLISQIITGLLLALIFSIDPDKSFFILAHLMESTENTWLIRYIHANGASLFFLCLYIHTARGIYYSSFLFSATWIVGTTILLLTMATAFLGYVLPNNQMAYWGASVITNLLSELPYVGPDLILLLWGNMTVSGPTFTRFFALHFFLPFVILALVVAHITFLHQTGSSNPLGLNSNSNKLMFQPSFTIKDSMGVFLTLTLFIIFCLYFPLTLGDDENFASSDQSATPRHIQPEWYFLFAYAILRSIPNKLGGVLALASSVLILYSLPFTFLGKMKSLSFYPGAKLLFWFFTLIVILLTWIGMNPVSDPFILTGQILTGLYFSYFLAAPLVMKMSDKLSLI